MPPIAVPELLVRKQLVKNTAPEAEQGQQMEWVWVISKDVSEMQPRFYYRKCLSANNHLVGKAWRRDCCKRIQRGKMELLCTAQHRDCEL